MKIEFLKSAPKDSVVFLPIGENLKLNDAATRYDSETGGALKNALKNSRFKGKNGEFVDISHPAHPGGRLVLAGMGSTDKNWSAHDFRTCGAAATLYMDRFPNKEACFIFDTPKTKLSVSDAAANLGYGALLKSFRFDKYFTKEKAEDKPQLQKFAVVLNESDAAKKAFTPLEKVAEGVFLTREVVSEPANVIYPETLAARFKELTDLGVKVEVLGEKEMRKLGMNALLGVAQGSAFEPKLVVMHWNGTKDAKSKPVAFVGKGVTFDTGGISIKPADGMWDMKWDMAGAGAVGGAMKALAGRKAPVNVVGVVGLVENMPSGTAQRPGDVVKSMNGITIEVLNTDAEGRLVLADAVTYVQQKFSPEIVIDLATLTGAIIVSLGTEYAGIFTNDDNLAKSLEKAGEEVGERLWRMPMHKNYDKIIDSKIADIQNIANVKGAGSINAAKFIERFIESGVKWAHLDIAGMVWADKEGELYRKGATSFGVLLLDQWVRENLEK